MEWITLQGSVYRFHPKGNRGYVLAIEESGDFGMRTVLIDASILGTKSHFGIVRPAITITAATPHPDWYISSYYLRLDIQGYENSFLEWQDKAQLLYGSEKTDNALFLFRYADDNWVNDPSNRGPDGAGWVNIVNPASGAVLDVAGGDIGNNKPVVGWGSNGGDNQQWWVERLR
jgi:hypothetical protein